MTFKKKRRRPGKETFHDYVVRQRAEDEKANACPRCGRQVDPARRPCRCIMP
jgi:hypothetical protein